MRLRNCRNIARERRSRRRADRRFLDDDVDFPVALRQRGEDPELLRLADAVAEAVVRGGPRLGAGGEVAGVEDVDFIELVSGGGGDVGGRVGRRRGEDADEAVRRRRSAVAVTDGVVGIHFSAPSNRNTSVMEYIRRAQMITCICIVRIIFYETYFGTHVIVLGVSQPFNT